MTRFYFSFGYPTISNVAKNATWNYTGQGLIRNAVTVKDNTPVYYLQKVSWNGGTAVEGYWVSDPLVGQTISGTVKMQLLAKEYSQNDNVTSRIEIYVVSNDGSTVRGTLLPLGQHGPDKEFLAKFQAIFRNKTYISAGTNVQGLQVQDGDRLVIVVGYGPKGQQQNSPEAAVEVGTGGNPSDPAPDLPENETQIDNNGGSGKGAGWIEFSHDFLFI